MAKQIALEHPALSTDPQMLCAAAKTCKGWRDAVQHCGIGNTAVVLDTHAPLQQLCSFARWLPPHAWLVNSLTLKSPEPYYSRFKNDDAACKDNMHAAQHVLQQALQLAAVVPAVFVGAPPLSTAAAATRLSAAAARAAAACLAGNGTVQQAAQHMRAPRGLQLACFITSNRPGDDCLITPALLGALPAHSLTRLEFSMPSGRSDVSGQATAAALLQLSNLRQLRLSNYSAAGKFAAVLAGIPQLKHLTSFCLQFVDCAAAEVHSELGSQLQQLVDHAPPLQKLQLGTDSTPLGKRWGHELSVGYLPVLDLSGLEQLEEFGTSHRLREGFVLPAQLQRLHLGPCVNAAQLAAVVGLQHLRQLSMLMESMDPAGLLSLSQLNSLQHLSLEYYYAAAAVVDAPAWRQLPLRELYQEYTDNRSYITGPMMEALLEGIAAATTLTRLQMDAWLAESWVTWQAAAAAAAAAAAGAAAAGDEQPEVIWVHNSSSEEEEEGLGVMDSDEEADEVVYRAPTAACASLARLTQLKHLSFDTHSPSYLFPGDVMALTALTNLTCLDLSKMEEEDSHLGYVDQPLGSPVATALASNLKQLRCLRLGRCDLGSMEWLVAIGQLQQLTELQLDSGQMTQQQLMHLTGLSCLQKFKLYNTV
jgi:hypothetical protein